MFSYHLTRVLLAAIIIGACTVSVNSQKRDPVKWSIKTDQIPRRVMRGDVFNIYLRAEIESGWQLYALEQRAGGPQPLRISLPGTKSFALAGKIKGPPPLEKYDNYFNTETKYYKGTVTLTLPVAVSALAPVGRQKFRTNISFRFCNEMVCYPLRKISLETVIDVAARKSNSRSRRAVRQS